MIEKSQEDVEQYEDKADLSIKTDDKHIMDADRLLATALAPQHVQASGVSEFTVKPQQKSCFYKLGSRSNKSRSF